MKKNEVGILKLSLNNKPMSTEKNGMIV